MKFSAPRDVFLKVLRAVSGVVDKKSSPGVGPAFSHVLLLVKGNMLSIVATDQEMEMISTAPLDSAEDGATAVSFRKLHDVCRALTQETITIHDTGEGEVILRAGRSRFAIKTIPASEYPRFQSEARGQSFSIDAKTFKRLLEKTAFAMAEQDVRYFLNGMLLDVEHDSQLVAVATDGHRLAMNQISLTGMPTFSKIIVPRKGVFEMLRVLGEASDDVVLEVSEKLLCLRAPWVSLTTRLLDGKFPDYRQVIPSGGDKLAVGSRVGFKEAFVRVSALFSEKLKTARMSFSEQQMKIFASNTDNDAVEEEVEVSYRGEHLDIGFNIKYIIDFLNVISSEQVRITLTSANHSALIEGVGDEGSLYVIMPMRL
ncbi:MAG: DNA polymerase III subunit beta [Francisellaceae bacterium]|nr:DNA polymerase III subunit beta [Francisellaceae bacterium]MBT6538546.1 DNA polymerase III subunit beta [Francisellaceae bacterium]